ncbi:MAG: hypothetical protein DU430_03245 [Candidatus Tokpelaia sp.]|nr:MAG: hypothetical protein DU430_03245 [Candidatus Tokpelaia sp.]
MLLPKQADKIQEHKMSGLLIDTKLITDIDAIADYFNKDSNKILRDLVAAELERIRPLLEAKKALNAANISHKNLEKQHLSKELPKVHSTTELEKSKPVEGSFAGEKIWERNWRAVIAQVLQVLYDKAYTKREEFTSLLPAIANINIARGVREDSGYIPMPELDISVQGLSAPRAGEFIQKVAEHYDISYSFKLRWSKTESGDSAEQFGLFTSDL